MFDTHRWLTGWTLLLALAIGGPIALGQETPPRKPMRHAPAYADHAKLMVVRDGAGRERPVAAATDWLVRRDHILSHFQDVAGRLPGGERRVPLEVKIEGEFRENGFVRKKISFATEPGDRVPAWLLIPDASGQPAARRPAALCLHQTIKIGKDEPVGLGKNLELAYAKELAQRGYIALAPDYPNFGDYTIDVYALGYASATMKAVWNNLRAVDLLCSLDTVDPNRIAVIGHSLGGHNAIFTALFDPRIKAVVSSCGFNAFPFYYKGNIAGWSHEGYMPRLRDVYQLDLGRVPFDWPELIGALAPRPFFTNSPLRDANFDVEGVKVCVASARPVYQLMGKATDLNAVYPDCEHAFPKTERTRAYEFLDLALARPR